MNMQDRYGKKITKGVFLKAVFDSGPKFNQIYIYKVESVTSKTIKIKWINCKYDNPKLKDNTYKLTIPYICEIISEEQVLIEMLKE